MPLQFDAGRHDRPQCRDEAGKGGQIARSAGAYAQLVGRDQGMAILRLKSGEQRLIQGQCFATVGAVSNPDHININRRQGWPFALAGPSPACSRCGHEPGRSPAWRWRRPYLRRSSPGDALGQADQGQADALEQVDRQVHHALAPSAQEVREEKSPMARSVWKGPFVDGYLLKKADKARESGRNDVIKIWSRRSTIMPQFVGLTFGVYNGTKHIPVSCRKTWSATSSANSPDADLLRSRRRQEGKEEVTMGKASRTPAADNEAQAVRPHASHQPAEAQPGCCDDPRQEGGQGAGRA
jgi:ribosomal protein S19